MFRFAANLHFATLITALNRAPCAHRFNSGHIISLLSHRCCNCPWKGTANAVHYPEHQRSSLHHHVGCCTRLVPKSPRARIAAVSAPSPFSVPTVLVQHLARRLAYCTSACSVLFYLFRSYLSTAVIIRSSLSADRSHWLHHAFALPTLHHFCSSTSRFFFCPVIDAARGTLRHTRAVLCN